MQYGTLARTVCKLIDNKIHVYDACGSNLGYYDPQNWKFIGCGVIHSVDGVRQGYELSNPKDLLYFWVKK